MKWVSFRLPGFVADGIKVLSLSNGTTQTQAVQDVISIYACNRQQNPKPINPNGSRRRARLLMANLCQQFNRPFPSADMWQSRLTTFRLPAETLKTLDDIAGTHGITRTGALWLAVMERVFVLSSRLRQAA